MANVQVVIGANYGDEGKGLVTDYLAAKTPSSLVVRFNGGAQAAHSVCTPDGRHHVFGHIGAGSFSNCPTYLSSHFVVNPMVFNRELKELKGKMMDSPMVYVDPNCVVTTPYDMAINQMVEEARHARHGSCGLGFNETIVRSEVSHSTCIRVSDLGNIGALFRKLSHIREQYVPSRLEALGLREVPVRWLKIFTSPEVAGNFLKDASSFFVDTIQVDEDIPMLAFHNKLLFEGAQGLSLDQNHINFPHVTRSNTGLKNVVQIIDKHGVKTKCIDVTYVIRCYATKHGAGPFHTELSEPPYKKVADPHNPENPHQGKIRYGLIDVDSIAENIQRDFWNKERHTASPTLAVTCLDQLDEDKLVRFVKDGEERKAEVFDFIKILRDTTGIRSFLLSYGPTRGTIQPFTA